MFCFSCVCVCGGMGAMGGFGIGLRRLLVAVNLCYVSVVCVRALVWISYRASSASCSCQSVFCFSCVCVCGCVGLDQILDFVGYL